MIPFDSINDYHKYKLTEENKPSDGGNRSGCLNGCFTIIAAFLGVITIIVLAIIYAI